MDKYHFYLLMMGTVCFLKMKVIILDPTNPQYRATLAFLYKELGEFEKAREQALEVLRLAPENKGQVEEFLRTLPLK